MRRLYACCVASEKLKRTARQGLLAAVCASALAAPAAAQSTVQPLAPTREEIERRQPAPPVANVRIEGDLERSPCALDEPRFADVRVTLRSVTFGGLGGIDPALLAPAYAEDIGRDNPVSAVCRIRDRAAAILRDAGYIAAVQVPEQNIGDGSLDYNVVLARLVDVRVLGNAGRSERQLAAYLGRLRDQPVFNRFAAERYLLLAGELPGQQVRLALRPAGTAPGEVVGEVTVLTTPFTLDANVQNLGSKELGRGGALLRAQLYGLTGLGDVTTAGIFVTQDLSEQTNLQLAHEFRLGGEGLTFGLSTDYSWARPDADVAVEVKARTLFASAWAAYPFVRRQGFSLTGLTGLDLVNQSVEQDGENFTRDRLRVAFLRALFDRFGTDFSGPGFSQFEPPWRLGGMAELRQGLGILGASDRCDLACRTSGQVTPSRPDADPTAFVARGSLYGEYRPVPKLTFALGLRGQWAAESLLSFEEFAGGNYTAGRGYDPGAVLGDRGYGVQAEIRGGSLVPSSLRDFAPQAFVFLDYARVANETKDFIPAGRRELLSTGGGLRATWRGFSLDSTLAFPLERAGFAERKPSPRLLFSITRRLWPWSP
ncbi:ShlB/FhaC/HecB family hemolysin secretion/activation protein [Sphingomonas mesophila]|uniref:ShlB/FhaC/HecB family hemolysin secretion/activation protein n=1 Tax=Sphingomonas mesophila TaxID=2303576 RepID=UPI000E5717B9|nr:ShlB/FhaC/HecB family hemolysin secretion/activation protein [Sphingomonas mesophila]